MVDKLSKLKSESWHSLSVDEVAITVGVTLNQGLDETQISHRIQKYGPNRITSKKRRSIWHLLVAQFSDFMILVLIAAAVVSGLVGEPQDAIAIVVIILLNAIIGFVQDYRAEKALEALKKLAAPSATVRRNGNLSTVPAIELVPGDVVLLEDGNLVPADLRVIKVAQLQINEAALTGESQAVDKTPQVLAEDDLALGDRLNMVYKGTIVTRGRGEGVVIATGMQTEIGKIASLLSEEDTTKTPLQKRLVRFGRRLALLILCICAVIFTTGLLRGEPVILMFLTAVSLAVAAIPEALPAVVTISLALGARKMVGVNALVRSLPAVETLGSITYICSDKTGTLTENSMRMEAIYCDDTVHSVVSTEPNALWDLLGNALILSNDVVEDHQGKLKGDPTEVAMYLAAKNIGRNKNLLEGIMPRVDELPFDADRKRMSTIHQHKNEYIGFTKGAAETVLTICENQLTCGGIVPLQREAIAGQILALAEQGYRVLALAYRTWEILPSLVDVATVESRLTFLGLVGLIDPPRAEAYDAVQLCKSAGITPVMITGDHPATAFAIAQRLGIVNPQQRVLTGNELRDLPDDEFMKLVTEVRVYARVTPAQKLKIVKALQELGEYVAMTGDGVNDAPALKRADIGVAMGLKGTDVAREASQLVLLDDNFATIVTAVREGRRIFDNIRKFIKYTMSSNSGEIWTLFFAPFLGLPIPLLPVHILWINLVTDGLPGLAFAAEPAEPGIMRRPPRPPNEDIFKHGMWQHVVWMGLLIGGLALATQAWALARHVEYWQTMVFTVLTVAQLFHALAIRSDRASLFSIGIFSNLPMLTALLFTMLLQLLVIYLPTLNDIFHTQPLPLLDLLVCLFLASLVLAAVELEKWLIRGGHIYQSQGT